MAKRKAGWKQGLQKYGTMENFSYMTVVQYKISVITLNGVTPGLSEFVAIQAWNYDNSLTNTLKNYFILFL